MAGMKFGATGNEPLTWAMNAHLPAMVCEKFPRSRIVAFSTGNVYGLSPVVRGGSRESDPLVAVGDYAMSCVGRERMFQHFSIANKTPVALIRLNYATETRYGVMVDMAAKVWRGEPVPLSMGNLNAIWQGDANSMSLEALAHTTSPASVFNIAGPEILSVRAVCEEFAALMKKSVTFTGEESPDALLSNAQLSHHLFGYPRVAVKQMIHWIADWTTRGGENINKPTHFETRDGTVLIRTAITDASNCKWDSPWYIAAYHGVPRILHRPNSRTASVLRFSCFSRSMIVLLRPRRRSKSWRSVCIVGWQESILQVPQKLAGKSVFSFSAII